MHFIFNKTAYITNKDCTHHNNIGERMLLHNAVSINRRTVLVARVKQTRNILRPSLGQELE